MGQGCPEESLEGDTALAGDLLGEEDCEWLAALGAAFAPPPPRLEGAGRKPRRPSSPRDPDEDEIQVVKVQQGGLTLPTRVKERPYERDDQRREAVPLVAGEGRMVVKKLTAGAFRVRKIIEFRKPRGRGPAHVEARWETVAAPPSGP